MMIRMLLLTGLCFAGFVEAGGDWADIGKPITKNQAVAMTGDFSLEVDGIRAYLLTRDSLSLLLDQEEVRGIRVYHARKDGKRALVLVGTDQDGQDLSHGIFVGDRSLSSENTIPKESAVTLTGNFTEHLDGIRAHLFSREVIHLVLDQDEVSGARFYHARSQGKPALVIVGVDRQGHDLDKGVLINDGAVCPDDCPNPSGPPPTKASH